MVALKSHRRRRERPTPDTETRYRTRNADIGQKFQFDVSDHPACDNHMIDNIIDTKNDSGADLGELGSILEMLKLGNHKYFVISVVCYC